VFYFCSELPILKLGISAVPMTLRTPPTQMKKNVDAIKLADMGLSLPTLSNRKYSRTAEVTASKKLNAAAIREAFCNIPFFLVMLIKLPVFNERIGFRI